MTVAPRRLRRNARGLILPDCFGMVHLLHHCEAIPLPEEDIMNDTERTQGVDNDEGLYNWWKQSRLSKRLFLRRHRTAIDEAIRKIKAGEAPAHYLAYEKAHYLPHVAKTLNGD